MLKRIQVLLEPRQHSRLQREARRRRMSVTALIREAVDHSYPDDERQRRAAYQRIIRANLPVDDWEKMEKRLERNRTRAILKGMR